MGHHKSNPSSPSPAIQQGYDLERDNGPLMTGAALYRALGFQSGAGFRQACKRKKLPINTFKLPGRRGRFARTTEVIAWLDSLHTVDQSEELP